MDNPAELSLLVVGQKLPSDVVPQNMFVGLCDRLASDGMLQRMHVIDLRVLILRLARESITYLDLGSPLGGRPNDPSCYRDGHVDYDRCSERPVFREALDRLVTGMEQGRRIALMCSEIDPERCHRSKLIGVELAKKGIEMTHIDRDGSLATQEKVIKRITGGQETLFGEGFQSRAKYDQPDDEPTRP